MALDLPADPAVLFLPEVLHNASYLERERAFNWYLTLSDHATRFITAMHNVHQRRLLIVSGLSDEPSGCKAQWRFSPLPYNATSEVAWKEVYFELTSDLRSGMAFIEHTPDRHPVINKHFFNSDFNDIRADGFMEACMYASVILLAARYEVQMLRSEKAA